jgi:hypothetical protein
MVAGQSDFDRQRLEAGIVVILSMAFLAVGTLWGYRGFALNQNAIDRAKRNESRFEQLRSVLPPRGIVGYLSDTSTSEDYFLTQYFLAPLVVTPDADRGLVVANCASTEAITTLASDHHLEVVRDFGNGVALLRRMQ